nr:copper-binding protein [Massilia niastensis]
MKTGTCSLPLLLALSAASSIPAPARADAPAAAAAAAASAGMVSGEVRKVDRDAGKLTIRHGPLASLNMPPMTMVFRVRDAALLAQLKRGDRIRFVADRVDGAFTVTRLEADE